MNTIIGVHFFNLIKAIMIQDLLRTKQGKIIILGDPKLFDKNILDEELDKTMDWIEKKFNFRPNKKDLEVVFIEVYQPVAEHNIRLN